MLPPLHDSLLSENVRRSDFGEALDMFSLNSERFEPHKPNEMSQDKTSISCSEIKPSKEKSFKIKTKPRQAIIHKVMNHFTARLSSDSWFSALADAEPHRT